MLLFLDKSYKVQLKPVLAYQLVTQTDQYHTQDEQSDQDIKIIALDQKTENRKYDPGYRGKYEQQGSELNNSFTI